MTVLQLCYRPCVTGRANRGPERLGDLPRVTERGNGRGVLQTAPTVLRYAPAPRRPATSEPRHPHLENDDGRP